MTRFSLSSKGLLITLLTLVSSAHASDSEYREILLVSDISKNILNPGTDPIVCGDFKLSTKQVLYYFKHAREVTKGTYAHDLDIAPCRITGKLELTSGIMATWEINLSGAASVDFDDGRYMYFNCERCIPKY
jgi:hypothetical protein